MGVTYLMAFAFSYTFSFQVVLSLRFAGVLVCVCRFVSMPTWLQQKAAPACPPLEEVDPAAQSKSKAAAKARQSSRCTVEGSTAEEAEEPAPKKPRKETDKAEKDDITDKKDNNDEKDKSKQEKKDKRKDNVTTIQVG